MNLAKKELKLVKKEIQIDLKRKFETFNPRGFDEDEEDDEFE